MIFRNKFNKIWRCLCLKLLLLSHPVMSVFVTPWASACQASLSLNMSWSLPKVRVHCITVKLQNATYRIKYLNK